MATVSSLTALMKDLSNTAMVNLGSIDVNSPAFVSVMILVLEGLDKVISSYKECQNHLLDWTQTPKAHLQVACPGGISNTCGAKPPQRIFIIQRWSMASRSGHKYDGIY